MKATGIVRRIDELGRVVIPKEIRRTLRIREGDPLEIYTDREGEVIFKKYSPIGELQNFASQYAETLNRTANLNVVICDRDSIIATAGVPKKDFAEKPISTEVDKIMNSRSPYTYHLNASVIYAVTGTEDWFISYAAPILTGGEVIGAVISLVTNNEQGIHQVSEIESKLIQTSAGFLGKQM